MNNTFKAKLIQSLANKKGNKGFTLIELLVVVIIIGVLAAIALPNLLGQVGKARESEAKSTLGAMNRAQQTVFAERGRFSGSIDELEVPVGNEKFYAIFVDNTADSAAPTAGNGQMGATGVNRDDATGNVVEASIGSVANGQNGTRDYAAGINYDPVARTFSTVVCRANNTAAVRDAQYVLHTGAAAADKTVTSEVGGLASAGVTDAATLAACDTTTTEEIK